MQALEPFGTVLQALPQRPQFVALVVRSIQAAPQAVRPALQRMPHVPSHAALPPVGTGQATLQAPQCAGSLPRVVQVPLQFSVPPPQLGVQAPAEQASPGAQRRSHAPQCSGSSPRSTQSAPHRAYPRSHTTLHARSTQLALACTGASHATSQAPQWRSSERVSTHVPPHASKPASQLRPHVPLRQSARPFSADGQPASQAPQ
jgi:hypothetical protein